MEELNYMQTTVCIYALLRSMYLFRCFADHLGFVPNSEVLSDNASSSLSKFLVACECTVQPPLPRCVYTLALTLLNLVSVHCRLLSCAAAHR